MENEKTSPPRRARDDETQVLEEADLLDMPTSATEAVDLGWSTTDIRPRRAAEALVAPLLSPAARVSPAPEFQPPPAVEGTEIAPAPAGQASPPAHDDRDRA